MKIQETITLPQKTQLILNNIPCGIFDKLFNDTEPLYLLRTPLSTQFYLNRSGEKTVARIYEQAYNIIKEEVPEATHDMILTQVNDVISVNILRPKYLDKWLRIYQVLAEEQYNALYDEDYEETREGSRNDKTTYDTEVENDGNVGTHETRTYTNETANDIYGFNSTSPVGDSTSEDSSSETVEGLAEKNTTHNTQSKTGTDTKDNEYAEKITRRGRKASPSELLQMELDFRNKQTIMSIILKDVDYETTLRLYERS